MWWTELDWGFEKCRRKEVPSLSPFRFYVFWFMPSRWIPDVGRLSERVTCQGFSWECFLLSEKIYLLSVSIFAKKLVLWRSKAFEGMSWMIELLLNKYWMWLLKVTCGFAQNIFKRDCNLDLLEKPLKILCGRGLGWVDMVGISYTCLKIPVSIVAEDGSLICLSLLPPSKRLGGR